MIGRAIVLCGRRARWSLGCCAPRVHVSGLRIGPMVVHRDISRPTFPARMPYWVVTHAPSGLRVSLQLNKHAVAVWYARKLDRLVKGRDRATWMTCRDGAKVARVFNRFDVLMLRTVAARLDDGEVGFYA